MVTRSKQWLNASRSTTTSTTSKSTLFNSRKISSGQSYIHIYNTTLLDQSKRFLSTKSHWNSALSTMEFPMAPPTFNSFTPTAKMTGARSRVLATSLMEISKDHLHASWEKDNAGNIAWCIMAGRVIKSTALTSGYKVSN
jgi:hypothetical protein